MFRNTKVDPVLSITSTRLLITWKSEAWLLHLPLRITSTFDHYLHKILIVFFQLWNFEMKPPFFSPEKKNVHRNDNEFYDSEFSLRRQVMAVIEENNILRWRPWDPDYEVYKDQRYVREWHNMLTIREPLHDKHDVTATCNRRICYLHVMNCISMIHFVQNIGKTIHLALTHTSVVARCLDTCLHMWKHYLTRLTYKLQLHTQLCVHCFHPFTWNKSVRIKVQGSS